MIEKINQAIRVIKYVNIILSEANESSRLESTIIDFKNKINSLI